MPQHQSRRPAARSPVPDSVRQELARRVDELLGRKFRPLLLREGRDRELGFNHAIDVFSEWRGPSLYFCVRYRTPSGRPEDDFIVRTTRLKLTGRGRLDLAYFRHTNRWQPVYSGLTLDESFAAVEAEEMFWPLT